MAVNVHDKLGAGGINLAHLNVASIMGPHKFEMLRQQLVTSSIQVFGTSETWLTEGIPDSMLSVKGYNTARWDRAWAEDPGLNKVKKGGGLLCFIHESLNMNEFMYMHLNQSSRDLEMQWVALEMPYMRNIVIINVYRPPQGDYKKACKLIKEAIGVADMWKSFLWGTST